MTKEEYSNTQMLLLNSAQALYAAFDNMDEFISEINRAESIGPILDARLYRKASSNLEQIKKIAKAIRKARNEIEQPLQLLLEYQAKRDETAPP